MENQMEWLKDRLEYLFPVLTVLLFASVLAIFYILSSVEIQAVVVAEEGTSGEQASAGVVNALVYILPAIIGGFFIAMLVRYGKKNSLKAFFGTAILMATTFISWLFINIILFVIALYGAELVITAPYLSFIDTGANIIYLSITSQMTIPLSLISGVAVAFIISSKRFVVPTKNGALLVLGGLMGAFLAMILPTWTVVFMLVLLSIYDIYSVGHGPIRDIMEYTYGPGTPASGVPMPVKAATASTPVQPTSSLPAPPIYAPKAAPAKDIKIVSVSNQPTSKKPPLQNEPDDDLLGNMTYSTTNWDLGIGDLVFYSLLGSHTLRYGARYIPEFGILAPISLFGATTVGIILGFVITLKLLRKNPMLPGLPMSIFLGLAGFGSGVAVLNLL